MQKYYFLPEVTEEISSLAGDAGSKLGTGGMKSKSTAQRQRSLGVSVFIGTGRGQEKFVDVLKGKGDGTYVGNAPQKEMKMNKQWIALHSLVSGQIEVDAGALLPSFSMVRVYFQLVLRMYQDFSKWVKL